jgi:hypothetical protein
MDGTCGNINTFFMSVKVNNFELLGKFSIKHPIQSHERPIPPFTRN